MSPGESGPMIEITRSTAGIVSYPRMAVPSDEAALILKSKSLEGLLQQAGMFQRLIGAMCPYGTYVFHAARNDETEEWTGSYEVL